MKLGIWAVGIALALTAGCGGAAKPAAAPRPSPSVSETPFPEVDTDTVDAAITKATDGVKILVRLSGTGADLSAQFGIAAGDFDQVAASLRPAPSGVTDSVARDVAASAATTANDLRASITCLDAGNTCESTIKIANADATKFGAALATLIPFGTRTNEQVLALLKP